MSFAYTVEDGRAYVTGCLEDAAPYYDVPAIAQDLYCQLGTWDLSTVDEDGCEVEFWATVFRHERGAVNLPECPSWCRLGPVHRFDSEEPSGKLVGWHEGVPTEAGGDKGGTVAVTLGQHVEQDGGGVVTLGPVFVTVGGEATEFTDPTTVRDLGNLLRRAAGMLDQDE